MINKFTGQYSFLSNFYHSPIHITGTWWKSVQHFYQAMKTLDPQLRVIINNQSKPLLAKRIGSNITIRKDWQDIKLEVMGIGVSSKFEQYDTLAQSLMNTSPHELIEGNDWGDTFWGVDLNTNQGENHLGKILMQIRYNLFNNLNPYYNVVDTEKYNEIFKFNIESKY